MEQEKEKPNKIITLPKILNNAPLCQLQSIVIFSFSRILLTYVMLFSNHVTLPYSPQFYNGKIEIAITNLNYNNGTTEIDIQT